MNGLPPTVTLQYDGPMSRHLLDALMAQQRLTGQFTVFALAGKPEHKPNILPHNVKYIALEDAVRDHATEIFVLTGGCLAQQYSLALQALTCGKGLVVSDPRLMAVYGDILTKTAASYHAQLHFSATLAEQGQLLKLMSPQAQPQEVLWLEEAHPVNGVLRQLELSGTCAADTSAGAQGAAQMRQQVLRGAIFKQWEKSESLPILMPTAQQVTVVKRLGGTLRYVHRLTHQACVSGLHFLPNAHPLAHIDAGSCLVDTDGDMQTVLSSSRGAEKVQVEALMQDILAQVNMRASVKTHMQNAHAPIEELGQRFLLLTSANRWRQATHLHAFCHRESLINTSLIVELMLPATGVAYAEIADLGVLCGLTHAPLDLPTSHLRLAV